MRQRRAGIGKWITDRFPQGFAVAVVCCLSVFTQPASAATLSFTGAFTQDDQVVFFPFTVTAASDATFRTLSYGGDTDANGDPVSSGGFDPVLSLFDGTGDLLIFVDDGAEPDIQADPATGLALDSFFTWSLTPGNYTLTLSQSNNYPGAMLADPFSRTGEGNFTGTYGCGTGQFFDFGCNGRFGSYRAEVLDVAGVGTSTAPLPGAIGLFASGLSFIGFVRYRSRSKRRAPASLMHGIIPTGFALLIVVLWSPQKRVFAAGDVFEIDSTSVSPGLLHPSGLFDPRLPNAKLYEFSSETQAQEASNWWLSFLTTPLGGGLNTNVGDAGPFSFEIAQSNSLETLANLTEKNRAILFGTTDPGIIHCTEPWTVFPNVPLSSLPEFPAPICYGDYPFTAQRIGETQTREYVAKYCEREIFTSCMSRYDPALDVYYGQQVGADVTIITFYAISCPVPPLTPLEELNATLSSDDPDTIWQENNPNTPNTARLTPETVQAKQCIDDRIGALGGTPVLSSAFRTEAYQRHLWQIYDRWKGDAKKSRPSSKPSLENNMQPECAALKSAVKAEWDRHGLRGLNTPPAFSAGKHPQGRALDYSRTNTIGPLEARGINIADDVAALCSGVTYPLPVQDKGHFER